MTIPKVNFKTLEAIARKHLRIKTLKTQNSDRLDFHDVSVMSIKDALEEAYQKGLKKGFDKGYNDGYYDGHNNCYK